MLIILTTNITPRLSYAAKQVFDRILSMSYHLAELRNYNPNSSDFVVHYNTESVDNASTIHYSGFCSEDYISNFRPELSLTDEKPAYFYNKNGKSYPVDIFSLSFYFLSRYEEYLDSPRDKHNRFRSAESIAGINGHLDFPIVDYWVQHFGRYLTKLYPNLKVANPRFKFLPTFDIDHAWKYKNKGLLRNLGGFMKDIRKLSFESITERFKVLTGIDKDPYYTFQEIEEAHKEFELVYFILLGKYSSIDININIENLEFRELIKQLSEDSEVGIHPSYASNKEPALLLEEINTLQSITNKRPEKSRQHFLKLNLPETYQNLLKSDITHDFTMGYADAVGFRAGTAHTFDWYDLSTESTTDLRIWPFVAMDVSLRNYLKLTPQEAFSKLQEIHKILLQTGGNLITIWHNSSFCNEDGWEEWVESYKEFLEFMKTHK